MAVKYAEKGYGLHLEIEGRGHYLKKLDGQWVSSDDKIVQDIIDNYDPIIAARQNAIKRVKLHASRLVSDIYPFIDPESDQAIGLYFFTQDLWQGGTLPPRLKVFKNIFEAASAAIADIKLINDWQSADAYDAVNTPLWP